MAACCEALQSKYRLLFDRGLDGCDRRELLAKASAWYAASFCGTSRYSNPCLSFGWVMAELLCEVAQLERDRQATHPLEKDVGKSIFRFFDDVTAPALQQKLSVVIPVARKMQELIESRGNKHLSVHMYGSISVFLCADSSDVDVCVVGDTSIKPQVLPFYLIRGAGLVKNTRITHSNRV